MRRLRVAARVAAGVLWGTGLLAPSPAARGAVFVAAGPQTPGAAPPSILRFEDDGSARLSVGQVFESAAGLSVDPAAPGGALYVAANVLGGGFIGRYNATSGQRDLLFHLAVPQPSPYASPAGIAVGSGVIYATSSHFSFGLGTTTGLLKFDAGNGAYLGTSIDLGVGSDSLFLIDVALGADARAYVSAGPLGILRHSDTLAGGETFVAPGSGGLSNPQGLAFGPDGNLYIANGGTSSVLRFDGVTGAFIDTFVPAGSGGMGTPTDLTFLTNGDLLVATGTDSVLRFNGSTGAYGGVLLTEPGARIFLVTTGVPEPSAVAVAAAFAAAALRRRSRSNAPARDALSGGALHP